MKLTEQHIRLIFALSHELAYMRTKLCMARIIYVYPQKKESRHPVINFALQHAETAIIEWLILRFAEAFQILNCASIKFLSKGLFVKDGRAYKSKDHKTIPFLFRMRDEYIAHRIMHVLNDSDTFKKVEGEYKDIFNFLDEVMSLIETIINSLEKKNIYKGVENLSAGAPVVKEFTKHDLEQLIETANALWVK